MIKKQMKIFFIFSLINYQYFPPYVVHIFIYLFMHLLFQYDRDLDMSQTNT